LGCDRPATEELASKWNDFACAGAIKNQPKRLFSNRFTAVV
jgi:hypothetical protein